MRRPSCQALDALKEIAFDLFDGGVADRRVCVDDEIERAGGENTIPAIDLAQHSLDSIPLHRITQFPRYRESYAATTQGVRQTEYRDAAAAHTSARVVDRPELTARR